MRRALSWIAVALSTVMACAVTGSAATGAPVPAREGGGTGGGLAAPASTKVCTVTDDRLRELSGLIATRDGYIVINDGTDVPSRKRVFYLDGKCAYKRQVAYSGDGPYDTEDLALSADGATLWIADTGDNVLSPDHRTKVALWSMPVNGSTKPVLHRLSYPEQKPHDAEALLIADDGRPIVVTKTVGKAKVFVPDGPLKKNNTDPVPMKQVGEIDLPKTTTENPLGGDGRVAVTGAARSPDGRKVVLRTYADAFEWDVPDGDIVKAITTGTPRATALADPFGEAISYTADGAAFVTVSESRTEDGKVAVPILRYTPSTKTAAPVKEVDGEKSAAKSWTDSLSLDDITYLIGAVGLMGLVLVGAGVYGIVRARRRTTAGDDADGLRGRQRDDGGWAGPEPGGYPDAGAGRYGPDPDAGRNGAVYGAGGRNGAVYGGGSPAPGGPGRPAAGGVYGGGASGGGPGGGSGGVYGGSPGGGVYGGGARGGGRSGGQPDRGYQGGPGGGPGGRAGGSSGGRGPGGPVHGGGPVGRGYREDGPSRGGSAPRGRGRNDPYDQPGGYDDYDRR